MGAVVSQSGLLSFWTGKIRNRRVSDVPYHRLIENFVISAGFFLLQYPEPNRAESVLYCSSPNLVDPGSFRIT